MVPPKKASKLLIQSTLKLFSYSEISSVNRKYSRFWYIFVYNWCTATSFVVQGQAHMCRFKIKLWIGENMKVLSFGEILWDQFREKKEVGGAALNFSAHLAKLGAQVHIVSAVGNDLLGRETLEVVKMSLKNLRLSL